MTRRDGGHRRSPFGVAALGVIGLALAAWGIVSSPFFAVREVRIQGTVHVDDRAVRDLSGLRPGMNLLRAPIEAAERSLETDPWIRDADVRRSWPSTVVIAVVERRPAAWLEDRGGGGLVAPDGTVLGPGPRLRVPALRPSPSGLHPGDRVPGPPAELRVLGALDDRLLSAVESASVREGRGVVLELRDGGQVWYGAPTELGRKTEALISMLRWVRRRGAEMRYIDLRLPDAPVLRLATRPRPSGQG